MLLSFVFNVYFLSKLCHQLDCSVHIHGLATGHVIYKGRGPWLIKHLDLFFFNDLLHRIENTATWTLHK